MSAKRSALGLAVLVAVVVVLSSVGLAGAGTLGHAAPAAVSSPSTPRVASVSPTVTSSSPSSAFLTSQTPAASASPSSPAALETPSGRMSSLVSTLRENHVPLKYAFLPDLNANPNPSLVNGHVNPTYSSTPAPLGVAEYGLRNVSGTITPYSLSTSSVVGTYQPYSMSGLSQDISGPDEYGVQLNSVLNNVTLFGNSTYQFWTQNVIEVLHLQQPALLRQQHLELLGRGVDPQPEHLLPDGPERHDRPGGAVLRAGGSDHH